jgi:predicted GNAT family N-acyltransferase
MRPRFCVATYNTPAYKKLLALRYEVLRKPLGQHFTPEQLASDPHSHHLGLYLDQTPVACTVLTPKPEDGPNVLQLRQFAVALEYQKFGYGRLLLEEAERFAFNQGFREIWMHARRYAEGFYEKGGYAFEGEEFDEVGIPHMMMRKRL